MFPDTGTFQGQCAEFCGLRHADMMFTVRAVAPAAFASWARSGGKGRSHERRSDTRSCLPRRTGGWVGALTSTDHKRIGLNLGICSLALLPGGRRVRAADARADRPAQRALRLRRHLQPAVHDARLNDDLPVRDADGDRAGALSGATADRRDRDVGAEAGAERLLGVAVGRPDHAVGLADCRRRGTGRLVLRTRRCRTGPTPPVSGRTCG